MPNEILTYVLDNIDKFKVYSQELQRIQRDQVFALPEDAENYIMDAFYQTITELENDKEDTYIFSISENTVVLMSGNKYFHLQIYDSDEKKEKYIIKCYKKSTNFNIHNYKNQGLTITGHLVDRYMQYFKKWIPFKDKQIHKEDFEKELMIKLKNNKALFAKELTDTVYMIVDNMYFVLRKLDKNTITLLTMRPFAKILELPKPLKGKIGLHIKAPVVKVKKCIFCENAYGHKDLRIAKDGTILHDSCLQKKYPNLAKSRLFDKYGMLYLNVLSAIPADYVSDAQTPEEWLSGAITYIEHLQEGDIEKVNIKNEKVCIHCVQAIENVDYFTRLHKAEFIHKSCAIEVIDIKSTQKIFENSGYKGLLASANQMKQQMEENKLKKVASL